jgi:nucleoside-triphosphatase
VAIQAKPDRMRLAENRDKVRGRRMTARVALTGSPGVGKSTLVERIMELYGGRAGGALAREVKAEGRRVGFELLDRFSKERDILAWENGEVPGLGRYRVNLRVWRRSAPGRWRTPWDATSLWWTRWGPWSYYPRGSWMAVLMTIGSQKPMLVVLKERSQCWWS